MKNQNEHLIHHDVRILRDKTDNSADLFVVSSAILAIPRMGLQSSDSSSHALRAAAGRHTAVAPTNLRIVD